MSEKAINDGQWNPWRLLQDAEFIIRDLSPDHDFPGRIRTAREAHDKAIASGTDPETAAEERGRRRGVEEALAVLRGFTRVEVAEVAVRELLAPRDSGPKKHRCMRCGDEFECAAPGCVALYDVLPRMIRGGVVVEHECKPRDSGKAG